LPLRSLSESKRLPEILPVFLASGAAVVVRHMGMFEAKLGPDGDPGFKALVEAAKSGRTYVVLSACSGAATGRTPIPTSTMTYAKMPQSLAEWVPDAATRRKILVDTPTRSFAFA
jgi:predicted TIM-barrel fold metal-dependent hydrolase